MEAVVPVLLENGLPGVIIAALGWALWKRSDRLDLVQDKRIQEMRESRDALNENTRALQALADLVKARGNV